MISKCFLAAPLALLIGAAATAQECGSGLQAGDVAAARALLNSGAYERAGGIAGQAWVVPLTFHVVRRGDGTGGLSEARLAQVLIDCDAAFASAGLLFCQPAETHYIDSDAFFSDIDTLAEIDALRTTNPVDGTINIYFTERLSIGSSGLCGISAFTFSDVQAIAVANNCAATDTNHSTVAHEIGHYFNLYHTHERALGVECVDGSNCADAGDQMCDTPADPQLTTANVTVDCLYNGTQRDNCSDELYAPDVSNLMSYSRKYCRIGFSPQQRERVAATLVILRPELALPACPRDCGSQPVADANCDGVVDNADIDAFVLALLDSGEYATQFPACDRLCGGDVNADGVVDNADIDPFVERLLR